MKYLLFALLFWMICSPLSAQDIDVTNLQPRDSLNFLEARANDTLVLQQYRTKDTLVTIGTTALKTDDVLFILYVNSPMVTIFKAGQT